MNNFLRTCILNFLLLACTYLSGNAQFDNPEVGIIEHLGEFIPTDVVLQNENDSSVRLADIINKPTVLNFVYYRCPGICTPLMNGLADVIKRTDMKLGKDFQVVTISFDPFEYPELAKRKKNNYMKLVGNQDALNGWKFFTADSATIAKLTNASGFKYKKTGNDFLHSATLIMVSPEGKISRYLNGITFLPLEFKLGIIEASEGKTGATINRVLQYCFSYDPAGQKYVMNITRISGVILTLFALIFILILTIRPIFKRTININKNV